MYGRIAKKRHILRGGLLAAGVLLLAVVLLVAIVAPVSAHHATRPTLTGTVLGEGDTALRGVSVQVISGHRVVARAVTDSAGYYKVRVAAGTYKVTFERRTYATLKQTDVIVTAPSTTLDATLTKLPVLTGTVTDGTSPLKGVNVKLMNGSKMVGHAVTDELGVYKAYVPAGTYDVTFKAYGYLPTTNAAVEVTAPSTTLDAVLTPMPVLTGTLTGAGGAPVKCALVKALSGSKVIATAKTDATGSYKLFLAEGTYDVKIWAATYERFSATGVAVVAPSTTFDAALTQLPMLTGIVTGAGGAPVKCAIVKVLNGYKSIATVKTDETGAYKAFVPAGTYNVKIFAATYEVFKASAVTVIAPSTTFDAALTQLPVLTGTVTGKDGVPLANARVKVMNRWKCVASGMTDANGVYKVYVAEGTYKVSFWAKGYKYLTIKDVVTVAPSTTLDATLTVSAPACPKTR